MSICYATWCPAFKEMAATCQFGRSYDASVLSRPRAYEQNESASFSHAGDDTTRAPEVGGRDVEGDDVDSLPYSKDIARVHGIPVRGLVSEMRLRGQEEFKGYI